MKKKNRTRTFYRVGSMVTKQGLWYSYEGDFTGLIHNEFAFCSNNLLKMPYDEKIVGYLSATLSLKELYKWFSKHDIKKLNTYGYEVIKYRSNDYFYHNGHWLIHKDSKIKRKVIKHVSSKH